MIFMNKTSWDSLSADDQKIISAAVAEGIAWNNEQVIKSEKDLITSLKNKGVTVITPDVDSFRDATVKQLVPQFESKWGKGTWDFIQDIK
jgi:TRAP-type C4-dicarboxylate transport system substrate-binding protein